MMSSRKSYQCQEQFFKTEETSVQGKRNFHVLMMYSNCAINMSVLTDSMMAVFTKPCNSSQ